MMGLNIWPNCWNLADDRWVNGAQLRHFYESVPGLTNLRVATASNFDTTPNSTMPITSISGTGSHNLSIFLDTDGQTHTTGWMSGYFEVTGGRTTLMSFGNFLLQRVTSDNSLRLYDNANAVTIVQTGPATFFESTVHHVAIDVNTASGGVCRIRVNGLDEVSGTNNNTLAAFSFFQVDESGGIFISNAMSEGGWNPATDRAFSGLNIGELPVALVNWLDVSGDSNVSVDWIPSTGGADPHWDSLDGTSSAGDYNSTDTEGAIDEFVLADLSSLSIPNDAQILGVCVAVSAMAETVGSIQCGLSDGTNTTWGTTTTLLGSIKCFQQFFSSAPGGFAWSPGRVDALRPVVRCPNIGG